MKRIFVFIGLLGVCIGTVYLYQRQLGAIPFLLISIYFFILAYKQLSKKTNHSDDEEKEKKNNRYS
ncbi:hypothetical protein ACFFHH_14120 [Cytobacillus solani]|uniref:Uncharacterized protein n=1 Tax=Cytobacillus solani TaxID=1637975 RepID=A0A0Q3QTS1_9BACI|nr:hypothetical protein [Cytobacillus solani]KOP71795.1 hypothetical protein AMS60_21080 [Bacillus sp. FJAT-21945]KQL21529.1 hypothetical protein AN957_25225 [Cytobacillus solani]USK54837.1 hypothetical protein LIS82_25405 [Cytobacillus solani]